MRRRDVARRAREIAGVGAKSCAGSGRRWRKPRNRPLPYDRRRPATCTARPSPRPNNRTDQSNKPGASLTTTCGLRGGGCKAGAAWTSPRLSAWRWRRCRCRGVLARALRGARRFERVSAPAASPPGGGGGISPPLAPAARAPRPAAAFLTKSMRWEFADRIKLS